MVVFVQSIRQGLHQQHQEIDACMDMYITSMWIHWLG